MQTDPRKLLPYKSRPEVAEVFADGYHGLQIMDGIVMIEFTVARFEEPKPPAQPTGHRLTACRLAITLQAFGDLLNNGNKVAAAMGATQTPTKGNA